MQARIDAEQERMETLTKGKREETQKKLHDAQTAHREADQKYKDLLAKRPEAEAAVQKLAGRGREMTNEQNRIQEQIVAVGRQLQLCDEREKSKLATFGHNLEQVIKEIDKVQWKGQRPVGPFGLFVQAKDPQKWGGVLRVTLGQAMSSWAVTHPADRQVLAKILKHYRK